MVAKISGREGKNKMKYIAFVSFGKDSLAQIIEIKRLGLPLDEVIYVDIKYSCEIGGEHPLMAQWIPTAERILQSEWGITVKHITSDNTFKEDFYKKKVKGKYIGQNYGFPLITAAWCNSRLKLKVINKYINGLKDEVCEYVGIACDEPNRYKNLIAKTNKRVTYRSVLFERGITESMAFEICKPYNLISPLYKVCTRGGCWFCVKQSLANIYDLFMDYPEYFEELKSIEKDSMTFFKPNCSLLSLEQKFINGYVPTRRKKLYGG